MCPVASGNVGGFAHILGSIRPLQTRKHTASRILEAQELRPSLDLHASLRQAIDQQTLVLVLGKDERVGKGTDSRAHLAEHAPCCLPAGHPKIHGDNLSSTLDDRVSETDLVVEFERPCLDRKRARRRSRLRCLVDDPQAHAHSRQPQAQYQARWSCANDEDVSVAY